MSGLRCSTLALCLMFAVISVGGSPRVAWAENSENSLDPANNSKPDAARVYRVGIDRHLPPFSFVDEQGRPVGSVVELLTEIGKVMELQLAWRVGSQEELREALRQGEIDFWATAPASLANEENLLLSESHSFLEDGYFVRAESGAGASASRRATDSMDSWRVITIADDPAQEFVAQVSTARLETEPSLADALRRLAAGEGDVALLPRRPGTLLMRQLQLNNLRVLPQPVEGYTRALSFAANADQTSLIEHLDQGLIICTENGTFLRIYSEWESYRGETAFDPKRVIWYVSPVLLLLLISLAWTWSLRREVARRTEELRRAEQEKRAVEARIAQTQKLESLAVLAGGVAHDFNNLLMAMLGNASLAMLQAPPNSPVINRLHEIEKAGKRAAELCQQMLNYSGRGRLAMEKIDLSQLIRAMSDLLEAVLPKNAHLTYELASPLPTVEGDPAQLRQVVLNLVTNAAEALQGPGKISIVTRASEPELAPLTDLAARLPLGTYVMMEVHDDGIGMDENTQARIFEPFFTTKFTGRGLGLAATLGILRGHRGGIQVESHLGEGSTFRVYLPSLVEKAPANLVN